MAIDTLTDNVLLDIFDFYRHTHDGDTLWEWHVLVHVCRRWRQIVFESPRRLDLKIRCTTKTPVTENLGIWPAFFPIAIDFRSTSFDSILGDAIVALEHTDRVAYLKLDLAGARLETLATLTSKPFPVLTHLIIHVPAEDTFLPSDFLGGSAPRLQKIHLHNVVFPALKTLLLSASDLVELQLHGIPQHHMISPVAMAMCLAELPRLKTLVLQFQSDFPHHRPLLHPPPTRTVLPALTNLEFTGPSEYLEDIVSYIDCPGLIQIAISYSCWVADFEFAQLSKFFNHSISPFKHAKVRFDECNVTFDLYRPTNRTDWRSHLATTVISCRTIHWLLFKLLNNFSAILSTVVDIKFVGKFWACDLLSDDPVYNLLYLDFLHQLPALQTLYASLPLAEGFGHALKSAKGEVVAEALPSLDLIGLEDQASSIEEFVAVRQRSDCPLIVVDTEVEFDQRLSEKERMSDAH